MFKSNAEKEIQREMEYRKKFEQFNLKEAVHRDNYKSSVQHSNKQKEL